MATKIQYLAGTKVVTGKTKRGTYGATLPGAPPTPPKKRGRGARKR